MEKMAELKKSVSLLIEEELERANKKFPMFASDHEGYAVIKEEMTESLKEIVEAGEEFKSLWENVMEDCPQYTTIHALRMRRNMLLCAAEAIQTAAMCEKLITSQECREKKEEE